MLQKGVSDGHRAVAGRRIGRGSPPAQACWWGSAQVAYTGILHSHSSRSYVSIAPRPWWKWEGTKVLISYTYTVTKILNSYQCWVQALAEGVLREGMGREKGGTEEEPVPALVNTRGKAAEFV